MERIAKSELVALRLKKAAGAVKTLSEEIEELKQRLSLVEIHNEELQDLIARISEDAAAIASTLDQSIEGLDNTMEDILFNDEENKEIAVAEAFSESGSMDVDFDF